MGARIGGPTYHVNTLFYIRIKRAPGHFWKYPVRPELVEGPLCQVVDWMGERTSASSVRAVFSEFPEVPPKGPVWRVSGRGRGAGAQPLSSHRPGPCSDRC